jgi:glycosyltransferase involved in cell wall biosynthesis
MPEAKRLSPQRGEEGSVAYVLKAFPRASEPFIASEIYRLEQAGLALRLFVTKPVEEGDRYPRHLVVDRIRAAPEYLPATTPLSATPLNRWLAINLWRFVPGLIRVSCWRPTGIARAAVATIAQTVRTSRTFWPLEKKVYIKEFLQAVALADRLRRRPDIRHLHAHYGHGATTITWLASLITGLPFSFTGHAKDIYQEGLNPCGLLARKLAAARFAVTCTDANRRHLQRIANGTPVHCVYHGVNTDFTELLAKATRRAPDGVLRILGVGRLVPKKGFDVFVDACGILFRRGVTFTAAIVGSDGEHGPEIRRRIAALGLDRVVRLTGPLAPGDLYEAYAQATVFCLPCRVLSDGDRDGIPNVLVEAMACGLPVISTGISGIPEVIADGVNGLLVPCDDPKALAEALLRLHRDPALASRLAHEGQAMVRERFDGDMLAGQLVTLFSPALLR